MCPDIINENFYAIKSWSELWAGILGRDISVGGFQIGTVPPGASYMAISINLLVRKRFAKESLQDFARILEPILSVESWERRQSESYLEGYYLRARSLQREVRLSFVDFSEFGDYDFWLRSGPTQSDTLESQCNLADSWAKALTALGYRVIRPINISREGSGFISFLLEPE